MTSIIRTVFGFLIARAPRNRLAALAAALLALLFARHLMREARVAANRSASVRQPRILEGEFHRLD